MQVTDEEIQKVFEEHDLAMREAGFVAVDLVFLGGAVLQTKLNRVTATELLVAWKALQKNRKMGGYFVSVGSALALDLSAIIGISTAWETD